MSQQNSDCLEWNGAKKGWKEELQRYTGKFWGWWIWALSLVIVSQLYVCQNIKLYTKNVEFISYQPSVELFKQIKIFFDMNLTYKMLIVTLT